MQCPYCEGEATLETGKVIYPHRPDLSTLKFWACIPCKAWVGCFKGTSKTMGRLANAYTRTLKSKAHAAFDPIWQSGYMTRSEAYVWLQKLTGLTADECHMGWMANNYLTGVQRACTEFCKDKGIK